MKHTKIRRSISFLLALIFSVLPLLSGCSFSGKQQESQLPETASSQKDTPDPRQQLLMEKLELLKERAFDPEIKKELGESPAGDAGFSVLLSVCSGFERATVFSGAGVTLEDAWNQAALKASAKVLAEGLYPTWVKADLVCHIKQISMKNLKKEVKDSRDEFFRYGVAFDPLFETALLEEEMNGAKIYHYEDGGIRENYLQKQLERTGRMALDHLPERVTLFRCLGWFCDEQSNVYALMHGEGNYGRRVVDTLDDAFVTDLIMNASQFLMDQVQDNGSFIYGYYPRFDNEISGYNMIRHVSTIWSLLCRYRLSPDDVLADKIQKAIQYAVDQMVYEDKNTAFLLEKESEEIKLGANSMAIVAMTEYMDVFGTDTYKELCCNLGNGILKMMDEKDGSYVHVLNPDFTLKDRHRTVYYDGEATFALSRLYGLTKDQKWLDAACLAVDHFINEDYTQYRDHWVSYAMNEITRHIPDNQEYYDFALANAQKNLEYFNERETTCPTCLELLMATYETFLRMEKNGLHAEEFHVEDLKKTIGIRVNRQLEGYFFPEYAMYMENPARILNTFMVRHDGFRVRIDDVQHNIGGLYLFCKNYDRLDLPIQEDADRDSVG